MEKRGLSTIVATLIIILLTLVAVGVIWVVVQNLLRSGAEQIELGTYTLDLEIKSVQIEGENVVVVIVKRNAGEGEFVGMNFIFSNGTDSEIIRENASLDQLDTRTFTLTLTKINPATLKTVSVVPIYKTSSGKESAGGVADEFDISSNKSMGTDGIITGNFAKNGFSGVERLEYTISGEGYPEFKNAVVDPLDVSLGDLQTFTVTVYSPNTITNVNSHTELDYSSSDLTFIKIGQDGENEIWSANWIVLDTHVDTYTTIITATDSGGNTDSITLTWTDAVDCNTLIPLSNQNGPYTITQDCSLNPGVVGGLMGGMLSLGSSGNAVNLTLNANSVLVTHGFQLVLGSGSHIIKTSSASIRTQGYLYYSDADEDGYAGDSTTMIYSATGPTHSGYVLINSSLGTDCYDQNADAYPGQTAWFTAHRGDGSWDYDCSSGSTPEISGGVGSMPAVGQCDTNSGQPCDNLYPNGVPGFTTVVTCGNTGTWITPGLLCGAIDCTSDQRVANCNTPPTYQYTGTGGQCDTNSGQQCDPLFPNGVIGFVGSVPNAGQTGTYVSDPSLLCGANACVSGTVTQAAH
ncbi:MAG: hypothetical protein NTW17_00705 [Candidatus Pacearchaeota archaeon]|nr:hypothetical protein [Candidatus Pacearchaeota archaeon]